MKKYILAFIAILFTNSVVASNICDEAETQFNEAVSVYKKKGNAAFMARILKNGPLEKDTRSLCQAQSLGQIEQFFGQITSASILSTKALGNKSCYIIAILEYKNGPAFAVANYYKGTKGVGATSMFFKTEPESILPKEFLVNYNR